MTTEQLLSWFKLTNNIDISQFNQELNDSWERWQAVIVEKLAEDMADDYADAITTEEQAYQDWENRLEEANYWWNGEVKEESEEYNSELNSWFNQELKKQQDKLESIEYNNRMEEQYPGWKTMTSDEQIDIVFGEPA